MTKKRMEVSGFSLRDVDSGNPARLVEGVLLLPETGGSVEVIVVDPQASMAEITNERLAAVAGDVREMLAEAVRSI